ncbi:alpha/beta hydrolase [Orrella sp. JC864]|uniref:alpha/beta hydrolase n=1 Tax=Orrella sp. JC864 TaxID=3120298 RepID=UPI00300B0581
MAARTETEVFDGKAGPIDCALDWPDSPRGWALVLHPHPLQGGARDNKVVTTIARACVQQGLVAVRPDFRGVGKSAGQFDRAVGETEDMLALVEQFAQRYPEQAGGPWVLGGFSFGSAVAAAVYGTLAQGQARLPGAVILAGTAVKRFADGRGQVPEDALLVHGEQDDVVPLAEVLDWARPQSLPICVVPGAGHFFHGKLLVLRQLVQARLLALKAG